MSYIIPMGLNVSAWDEWCEYRQKARKKKVSEFAAKKQFKTLLKYTEEQQQQIIDNSISNDYQGLFDLKGGSNAENRPNSTSGGYRLSAVDRVRAKSEENRATRANNRHNLENASGDIRQHDSGGFRGRDAGGMDSVIEGDYTQSDS